MTREEKEIKELTDRFTFWRMQIKADNANYLFDANKFAEPLSLKLLNLLYDLELTDENDRKANAPGIDLGDEKNAIAFQVTSRTDNSKIIDGLRKAVKYNHAVTYHQGIRFFVLGDGEIEFKDIKPTSILHSFDEKRDIVYPTDVVKRIKKIYETDEVKFLQIKELFQKEIPFPEPEKSISPQFDPTTILRLLQQQIEQANNVPTPSYTVGALYETDLSLPASTFASQRQATVDTFITSLNHYSVIWMSGSIDTGKTSLAILIGQRHEPNVFWLDFQTSEAGTFFSKMVSLLASYLAVPLTKNRKHDLTSLIAKLPLGSLIVINDLPDLAGADKAKQEFINFCQQLSQSGTKMLITGNQPAFAELEGALAGQFLPVVVPPFVAEEVAEVLRFYGATDIFIEEQAKLLTSATDGHAFLVHNAALYLKSHEWSTADDVIIRLFKNEYGQSYTSEVYAKILASTTDEGTQMLLYRTAIIMGPFTDTEVDIVGTVEPAIERTHQRSQTLKGAWFQESERGRFILSPLVKRLGNNLPEGLQRKISERLGDKLTDKSMLSQVEAYNALFYYLQGKSYAKLSWLLMKVLEFSLTNPAVFFDWGFQYFWYRSALPQEIPPIFKALIRGLQLQLASGQNEETGFLISDLEQILKIKDVGLLGCTYAELTISHITLKSDPAKSFQYFLQVRKNWLKLQEMFLEKEENPILLDDFFWTSFYSLRKKEDFERWFGLLQTADYRPDRTSLECSERYLLAAHSLVNTINIPVGTSSEPVIDTLQTILRLAIEAELNLIAVYALRYLVVVYGSYTKQFPAITKLLDENSELISSKAIYTFLVYEEYGRQLFYDGKMDEATEKLSPVIDTVIEKPFLDGVEGLRVYSQLIGNSNVALADVYIQKSVIKAQADEFFPETERLKLMGEAAVSKWLLKKWVEALHLLEEAYARLLNIFQETEEHQALLVRLSHVANYISVEILSGKPPGKKADGSVHAVPERGMFYKETSTLLSNGFYFEERKFMGANLFQEPFEFLGDYERAGKWALLNIQVALSLKQSKYFPALLRSLPYLILERQYLKAINLYLFVEERLEQIRLLDREGKDIGEYAPVRHLIKESREDGYAFAVIMPLTTITLTDDILHHRIAEETYPEVIENLLGAWSIVVRESQGLNLLRQIFNGILINRISFAELEVMINDYESAYKMAIMTIAYILQSVFADAKEALNLQLRVARVLDTFQLLTPGAYRFEIAPFLQSFWIHKFREYSNQVKTEDFWYSKSLPYLEKSPLQDKVRHLFKVVTNHIEVTVPLDLEDWIKS